MEAGKGACVALPRRISSDFSVAISRNAASSSSDHAAEGGAHAVLPMLGVATFRWRLNCVRSIRPGGDVIERHSPRRSGPSLRN